MANTRLDVAYASQIKAIRLRLQAFALARFNAGQYRDVDMAKFIEQVTPVILAGRQQVSALTDTYLTTLLSAQLGRRIKPVGTIDPTTIRGVDVNEVYARPFVTVRTKLSQGLTFENAVQAGAARIVDLVATDMQLAKTHTAKKAMESAGVQFYRRTLTGSKNCALCVIASTQHYRVSSVMPIHPGCDCGFEPLPNGTKRFRADDGGLRVIDPKTLDLTHEFIKKNLGVSDTGGRTPDYRKLLVVHQHGEIGPVLAFKGHKFSGPSVTK